MSKRAPTEYRGKPTEMVMNVKAKLQKKEAEKFEKLRKKIGTTKNSETLRAIINRAYQTEFGERTVTDFPKLPTEFVDYIRKIGAPIRNLDDLVQRLNEWKRGRA